MRTNIFLRLIWFSLALAGVSLPMSAYNEETEKLLKELDEMIERPEQWEDMKSYKIIQLHKKEASVRNNEERYEINKKLFEEYSVFNADSAVSYAMRNKEIAKTEGNVEKMILWDINRSFALAVTGLLKESQDIIDSIDLSKLPVNLSPLYFNQLAYLYSHFGQYQGKDRISPSNYYEISKAYRDSTYSHAKASDELYLWYKAWASENREGENLERMKDELRQYVDSSYMTTRKDAMLAYALSNLYKISNDKENQIKYLAISAICDIRTSNKDIASLEELGKLMLEANEIDRAYSYINFCQRQARSFNNRIRSLSLSHVEKEIREYYSERDARQQRTLHAYVVLLSVLSLILIGAVFIIINRNKRLSDSRQSLSEVNDRLKDNIKELTGLREEIRRERTIEFIDENKRYDDIIRWKTAEYVLPADIIGAKFTDESGKQRQDYESHLTTAGSVKGKQRYGSEDDIYVIEFAEDRRFDPERDYLYPVPLYEIAQSGNAVTQNPKW